MKKYTVDDLLKLKKEIENNLPEEYLFETVDNMDIARFISYRESCLHRVSELADSVYENFLKKRVIASSFIVRGFMEMVAQQQYVLDNLKKAIKNNNFTKIKKILTKLLAGSKDEKSLYKAENVLNFIDHMDEKYNGFRLEYDNLSEFVHPNSAGMNRNYSKIDHDLKKLIFGNNQKLSIDRNLQNFCINLEYFINQYDDSANLLESWSKLAVNARSTIN